MLESFSKDTGKYRVHIKASPNLYHQFSSDGQGIFAYARSLTRARNGA